MLRPVLLLAAVAGALALAPAALADSWLPHPKDAEWVYEWSDTRYNPTPTKEKVTVASEQGDLFALAWTTSGLENPAESPASEGVIVFKETDGGVLNADWRSTPPPATFPVLCPALLNCNNSLASTYYNVIWGTRSPTLIEPLLRGTRWASTGGAAGDVVSSNQYLGAEPVSVPAFPAPVRAAKVRSVITQAGALGDPYGSGVRTVWWVYGVGPVKVVFEHAGGDSPITTSVLASTNLQPKAAPPDVAYLPFNRGAKLRYTWTNSKHMKKASRQEVEVAQVANGSARLTVKHLAGPIRVAGEYGFTTRTDGITNIWAETASATLSPLPKLGPRTLPADERRNFATPLDLMVYGFNPILPAYPVKGDRWAAKVPSRDFSVFGVRGTTRVLGVQRVKVPAGTFNALAVQTTLTQAGFRFGSGTRTSWFAPGRGLVKLVFRHGDGSVSTVQLTR